MCGVGVISLAGIVVNNNIILRKLRIAFEMRDTDMVSVMRAVKFKITKSEINSLFRNPSHKNYTQCGDQFMRNFLKGLAMRVRPTESDA